MNAKVFPALDNYLTALCYLFLTDKNVRAQCDRCGVRFASLPKTQATESATKAQAIASFELARHELKDDAAFLEMGMPDLRQVPVDDVAFLEKLNGLLENQKVYELCAEGMSDPIGVKEKIKNFQESLCTEVSYGPLDAVMSVYLPEWSERVQKEQAIVKIKNFERLSEMIGGFNPGRIGILLAETGFGKTNLGLSLALNARATMATGYANQEMSFDDISKRIAVLDKKIKHRDFYQLVKDESFVRSGWDNGKGFYITNGQSLSVNQIKGWVRSLSRETPIRFLVIDYDQCLNLETSRNVPEWKALQNALADFDNFSREVECFILVLAQLNREGEISGSHRSNFKSHVTLKFFNDDEHGPIIRADKNRNGIHGAFLKVDYDTESSLIREIEVCPPKGKKKKREIKLPPTPKNSTPDMRYPYAD